MRILSWNVRRAKAGSPAWDYLLECAPDLALLQEVGAIPDGVQSQYQCRMEFATGRKGGRQKFRTAILVRGEMGAPLTFRAGTEWVDSEIARFDGNLVANEVAFAGVQLTAVSVYSPAWPVDPARLVGIDVSNVRLKLNRNVWIADILWAALQNHLSSRTDLWVVAGDFNLSETFDLWRGGPRGNREYLDRMIDLGLVECLRTSRGALTPTYRNTDQSTVKHQMDHMFASAALAERLRACVTGPRAIVFDRNLSDHLPLIADFDTEATSPPHGPGRA